MTSKLVIVGNGFDLCHGLKTNYRDFLESEYCSDQLKQDLSEIEDYIKAKQNISNEGVNLWTDMEYMYYRAMVSIDEEDFSKVENFNSIIEDFKMEFMRYLDNCL
ncbi:AbiH family protein [uncultured Ligilactobacillus sp.]|uniref:AbiH family protein n=1 Tax=uncultured Ligilactobacillus sp. TaxID=2837633 RepID=UPI00272D4EEA|nr:AbiH family protein [uncultured Ligilactobacillus sp.]